MSGFDRPELLASTAWLAERLGEADLCIVDLRWRTDGSGAALHAAGHIPGAVHLDWAAELVEREESGFLQLAGRERIADALASTGVMASSRLVLYDDTRGLYAARAWWSLLAWGVTEVRILDGGLPAWQAEGRPIEIGRAHV